MMTKYGDDDMVLIIGDLFTIYSGLLEEGQQKFIEILYDALDECEDLQ